MASYNELNALIDAYINRNGVQAITGQILNGVLKAMVDQVGRGYAIMGVATPSTNPGTPDAPESWFASTPGIYTNFGGLEVADAEFALLSYTPSGEVWTKTTLTEGIQEVSASIDGNVGTPEVTAEYINGGLIFTFSNMKGQTGDAAGFGTVNATVDGNIGTPGVSVNTSGPDTAKNITFQFTNLKGETGVTSCVVTVDNTTGTPSCAVSLVGQELHLDFSGLKGAQGNTGSSVDYPFTIVNNLTTDDATQALSAAMGVQLESEVSQLEAKVDELGADADYRQSRTPAHIFRNLFDKTDPSIVDGYYVNHITGILTANARYVSTGYIPVLAGYDYYMSYKSAIAWYDKDKVFISGSASSDTEKVQTAPSGAAFLRCTITSARLDDFIVAQSSVAVDYAPYGMIKASEINGVLSDSNIPGTIARREDAVLKKLGVNLFDQSSVTDRKILGSDGSLLSGSAYETSDYIPVTAGESYYLSDIASILTSSAYVCFYDASKAFVSSVQSASGKAMAITIPSGCAYVRFSLTKANIRKPQFELGNARTKYFPYSIIGGYVPQIADETVYSESIVPGAITSDKVVDKAIGIKQTSIVFSVNMLDKEDADVATGKYVNPTTGNLSNNTGYNTSGFIGVLPGKTYYFGSLGNTVSPAQYALYDNTKVFVVGGNGVSFITIPAGCYYIRFTLTTVQWGNESAQMTLGSVLPYSVYEIILDPSIGFGSLVKKFDSSLGNAAHTLTKATLLDGETLTDSVFPRFQLKGLVMSMACKISTMGTLIVGKGYQQRLGQYLRITSTTVEFIRCDLTGTESVRDTATHGLTIADFLRVSMYYIGNGYLRYIVSTSSGYFQKDISWYYYGEYDPFVKSTGTSASDVKLSIGSRDLKKPIWCFGDSNQSVSDNRWPGVLRNIGCFEFMINALTGINSVNALADAVRAFSFGTPKFAFWGLGGNDASDTNASTPAENWLSSVQSFIDLCKANGTIPILSTIACTPSKNHEGKNAWVRASGYRYIDIADAVGGTTFTSGVDTWYSGMLSEDNVHPTELGAQAMASRVLADLPEIMQQNQDIDYIS